MIARVAHTPASVFSYDLGLIPGHIFAALRRNELNEAETDSLLAFVRTLII